MTLAGIDAGTLHDGLERLRVPAATALALVGVAALLLAVRRLFLAWHARKPRVQITTFGWTGATDEAVSGAAWVTSLFRNHLAGLQLDALDPLPERSPGAPLVEIFAGVGQGSAVGKALAGVVKVVTPDCAYSVWGTLRPHGGDRPGGHIGVELVDGLRHRTLLSATHTADDWSACTRAAAMSVAGALYPRVARRHQGPWGHWTQPVPAGLVESYHDATDHEQADRLEEALDGYHQALRQDPLNPHLRICIAMVQERLGLYLDAWATYQAITTETDRRAWRSGERRARLLAQYRLAILLGYEQAGQQWMRAQREVPSERDRERQRLRAELAIEIVGEPLLELPASEQATRLDRANAAELWRRWLWRAQRELELESDLSLAPELSSESGRTVIALLCGGDPLAADWEEGWPFAEDARIAVRGSPEEANLQRVDVINELLQILALRRLEELRAWQRPWPSSWRRRDLRDWLLHRPPLRLSFARYAIAGEALGLSFTCLRLRMRATRYVTIGPDADSEALAALLRSPIFAPSPDGRRARRGRWRPRRPGWDPDDWLTDYNAACTAAVPLVPRAGGQLPLPEGVERSTLVAAALGHLERYAHGAGSARFASQEAWIGAEDPDLAGLAESPKFQEWARHHLSQALPKQRPLRSVDVGYHLRVVLRRGAQVSARRWHARSAAAGDRTDVVARWWRDEAELWTVCASACVEFRSWRSRLAAVRCVNAQLVEAGEPPVGAAPGWRETSEVSDPDFHERRVGDIAAVVGPASATAPATGVLAWVQSRQVAIQTALEDGAELAAADERDAALKAFRLWSRVADALDPTAGADTLERLRAQAATLVVASDASPSARVGAAIVPPPDKEL
jgi:hypothetical protein